MTATRRNVERIFNDRQMAACAARCMPDLPVSCGVDTVLSKDTSGMAGETLRRRPDRMPRPAFPEAGLA
jgi:hypothetical protein